MKTCPHEDLYENGRSSFIHNTLELEITQISVNLWKNKQIVL